MKDPTRMQGKCVSSMINKNIARPSSSSGCFWYSRSFHHSKVLVKVYKSVFSRLHFLKPSFLKVSCRRLMNISEDASPKGAHRIRRRSLTFALSWVRLSCTMAPRISRSPRVILTMKQDEGLRRRREMERERLKERKNEEGSSQRVPLMSPKVEQTVARTRYFKASFTGEIDLIEGIARNESRMRSASRSRFDACSFSVHM